jgi:hypothetical protein
MVALSHYVLVVMIGLSTINEVKGSFWDHIPVISQIKSVIQDISGDDDGARQTMQNYLSTDPVSAIAYHTGGKHEKANENWKNLLNMGGEVVDSLPVVGHIKGGYYYGIGERERGEEIMKSASRPVGVIAGGVGGFLLGGPVGAVAGGIAGGTAADGVITGKGF